MQSEGNIKNKKIEVAIVMDVTGSMQQWIDASCETVLDAFSTLQNENPESLFRLACVCYRDFGTDDPFVIVPFTEDITKVQNTLKNTKASGGHDKAEDVAGALEKVLELEWSEDTCKLILWVCDAPAHGNKYHSSIVDDRYPKGDPHGREPIEQMKELYLKGIDFTIFRICKSIDKMVEIFSSIYEDEEKATFTLLDLVKQGETSINKSIYEYGADSIMSGFIDLSTYDCDDYKYRYGKDDEKEIENESLNITFCSSTIESVRKTISMSSRRSSVKK